MLEISLLQHKAVDLLAEKMRWDGATDEEVWQGRITYNSKSFEEIYDCIDMPSLCSVIDSLEQYNNDCLMKKLEKNL